jgi:hypothetical protein
LLVPAKLLAGNFLELLVGCRGHNRWLQERKTFIGETL